MFAQIIQKCSKRDLFTVSRHAFCFSSINCNRIEYYESVRRQMEKTRQKIGIIGVPMHKGQRKSGVALGPKALRAGGLIEKLQEINELFDIKDFGDVPDKKVDTGGKTPSNMIEFAEVIGSNQELSKMVQEVLAEGRLCVTLGGDHALAVGSIDGHISHNKNVSVLWVDAHPDLNTNATSTSGNVHGMSVALLAKELSDFWPYLPGMDWQIPQLSIKNFAYIGLRSVDPYERFIIDKFNILAYGMRDIERYGINHVVKMALQHIDPDNSRRIHVSFDIDALDSFEAPSTGTSVRGGLTLREGVFIMEEVFETGRLDAIDLVEVNPDIGNLIDVRKTVDAGIELVMAACGNNRNGNLPKNVNDIPFKDDYDISK